MAAQYPYYAIYPIPTTVGGKVDDRMLCYWTGGLRPLGSTPIENLIGNLHGYPRGNGQGLTTKRSHLYTQAFTFGGRIHISLESKLQGLSQFPGRRGGDMGLA